MSKSSQYYKHMEYLMAMSSYIESTRLPSLGYTANIESSSRRVQHSHRKLVDQRNKHVGMIPVKVKQMRGRYDA